MAFFQTYTGATVAWPDAVKLVLDGEGDLFCIIVEEAAKGSDEPSPAYGFFFRYKSGQVADVFKSSRAELMTTRLAAIAHKRLLEAYPDTWSFVLPDPSEANIVRRGDVLDQVTVKVKRQPRLEDPIEFF